ncbi:MAG TPA: hypothetical protein VJG32_20360 [Anaerolineae bacterium]|nr:hypothetical protein [Anaerolineae bacterium]
MVNLLSISLGLATGALALGYAVRGEWIGALLIVALGLSWWVGQRRGWNRVTPAGLISFTVLAAFGVWRGVSAAWMVVGVAATLATWDLDHFDRRLRAINRVEGERELIRAHARRLFGVAGLGLVLAWIASGVRVELTFAWALLLGLIALLALSRAVKLLPRPEE